MLLTKQERDKFAAWCERNVESCEALIGQLSKLPHGEAIAKTLKMERAACAFIAHKLRTTEDASIEAPALPVPITPGE